MPIAKGKDVRGRAARFYSTGKCVELQDGLPCGAKTRGRLCRAHLHRTIRTLARRME